MFQLQTRTGLADDPGARVIVADMKRNLQLSIGAFAHMHYQPALKARRGRIIDNDFALNALPQCLRMASKKASCAAIETVAGWRDRFGVRCRAK